MNDTNLSKDELRQGMADYLGDEMNPEARARYERSLRDHADLTEEVRSLRRALQALDTLDAEPHVQPERVSEPAVRPQPWFDRGRLTRFVAMIALAFFLGSHRDRLSGRWDPKGTKS